MNSKKQILELCHTLLKYYKEYLTPEEIKIVNFTINNLDNSVLFNNLLPIVEKIWEIELNSGKYKIISWNKYSKRKTNNLVTFATLSKLDDIKSFCNLNEGIEYKITYKSIIGALPKDAATLIENKDNKNEFTIKEINDKVINSYNGATKLITPKQLIKSKNKYNELILDSMLIEETGTFKIEEEITEEEIYKLVIRNKLK